MKRLVVISGKGGTGKTSVVASFAALARDKVLADCDVDAADLHLVLAPQVRQREEFTAGKVARVQPEKCAACGRCAEVCRFEAVHMDGPASDAVRKTYRVDPIACEGCSVCTRFCPTNAILLEEAVSGEWFVSDTRHGPMVHARLGIAAENSGKLVTLILNQARKLADERGLRLIIADGSPGIGCPVIASVAGATLALVVTEPTLSALHDMERACQLTRHFGVRTALCVNKHDLNPELTRQIAVRAREQDTLLLGTIPYDPQVTAAQIAGKSVVEHGSGAAAESIRTLWQRVKKALQ